MSVAIPPAPTVPGVLPMNFVGNDGRMHSEADTRINLGTVLKGAGIGAAAGGVLGGVALLGKFALPLLGKVTSVAGLLKFGLIGGVVGLGIAGVVAALHANSMRNQMFPNVPGFGRSTGWVPVGRVF